MASLFTHAFTAYTFGRLLSGQKYPLRFWTLGMLCSIIPDLDVLTFAFGVRYGDFWGHRGFSHSLLFAALLAILVTAWQFRESKAFTSQRYIIMSYFFLCTASHGFLDAMTNGGLGVAFFAPFDNTRYFLPWQPIRVSPISVTRFFSERGLQVIISEMIWIWLPGLLVILIFEIIKKVQAQNKLRSSKENILD